MKAIIKIGDSFALPIQFYDTTSGEGLTITYEMHLIAEIVNSVHETYSFALYQKF